MADNSDWQAKLPFLAWEKAPDGKPFLPIAWDGEEFGLPAKDGSIVLWNDERVAEYHQHLNEEANAEVRKTRAFIFESMDDIRTSEEAPFSTYFMLRRPGFMRWLEGMNPNYIPTIMEDRMAAAYADRKRHFRERGNETSATSTGNTGAGGRPAFAVPKDAIDCEAIVNNARRDMNRKRVPDDALGEWAIENADIPDFITENIDANCERLDLSIHAEEIGGLIKKAAKSPKK